MRQRKHEREKKRQKGQFMTPDAVARRIVAGLDLTECRRILEPSCGDGAFLAAMVDRLRSPNVPKPSALPVELTGIEIDPALAGRARERLRGRMSGDDPFVRVTIREGDFFRALLPSALVSQAGARPMHLQPQSFDLIVGNPPFGGTFDRALEDRLDRTLGKRGGGGGGRSRRKPIPSSSLPASTCSGTAGGSFSSAVIR